MSQPGQPVPPLFKWPFTADGKYLSTQAMAFLTQLFNGVFGNAGLNTLITTLQHQVAIIFGMSGDGTLTTGGVLTVTKSNGVPFAALAFLGVGNGLESTGGNLVASDDDVFTVGTLPTPAAPRRAFVSDSTVAGSGNFGATPVGGAGFTVPVYFDGAAWFIG